MQWPSWQAEGMRGRYASSRKPEDLVEEFGVEQVTDAEPLAASLQRGADGLGLCGVRQVHPRPRDR